MLLFPLESSRSSRRHSSQLILMTTSLDLDRTYSTSLLHLAPLHVEWGRFGNETGGRRGLGLVWKRGIEFFLSHPCVCLFRPPLDFWPYTTTTSSSTRTTYTPRIARHSLMTVTTPPSSGTSAPSISEVLKNKLYLGK